MREQYARWWQGMFKRFIKGQLAFWAPRKFIFASPAAPRDTIALTFDDGPYPVNTERILEILRGHKVKVTFFVSGNAAEHYPHVLKAIHDEGHEIGNHGYEHMRLSVVGYKKYAESIRKTDEVISAITGRKPTFFRPPYGELSFAIVRLILSHPLACAMWSKDSRDSFIKKPEDLFSYLQTQTFKQGDVVLFHDDQQQSIQILDQFLRYLKETKIDIQPLGQMLSAKKES